MSAAGAAYPPGPAAAARVEFDQALQIIRDELDKWGNDGDAYPDEYARWSVNHQIDPATVGEWAHLVLPQPDLAALAERGEEAPSVSDEGLHRLALTLMAHTGADQSDPETRANYLIDAVQLAAYMPHLLTASERWASKRTESE